MWFITTYPKYFESSTYKHTYMHAYVHTYNSYWTVANLMQNLHLKRTIIVKFTGVDSLLAGDHSPQHSITEM